MRILYCISKIGTALFLLAGLILILAACEPGATIHVLNQTDETLQIFDGNVFIATTVSGEEKKFDLLGPLSDHYTVVAKDLEGNVVYTTNFTRRDLSGKKTYTVVIPPTARPVEPSGNVTVK